MTIAIGLDFHFRIPHHPNSRNSAPTIPIPNSRDQCRHLDATLGGSVERTPVGGGLEPPLAPPAASVPGYSHSTLRLVLKRG
jgi:hypothetical protein